MKNKLAFWCALSGVFFFTGITVIGGILTPDYSHANQLISELYATGAPYQNLVRYGGMIPAGISFILFSFFAWKTLPKSKLTTTGLFLLGVFYGFATVMITFFPCDEGCNKEFINPSLNQLMHNFIGGVTYVMLIFSILMLSIRALKWPSGKKTAYLGFLFLAIYLIISTYFFEAIDGFLIGFYQRVMEALILLWILQLGAYIKITAPKS